jgi:hypothetical protein
MRDRYCWGWVSWAEVVGDVGQKGWGGRYRRREREED